MATPRGTFEMRFFFTVAIASANGGDAHSAESVKHRIKALIDAETPGKVMSDDDIVAMLNKEGIDLARRTVAKYREALGHALLDPAAPRDERAPARLLKRRAPRSRADAAGRWPSGPR